MIFRETPLTGVFLIEPERLGDERGFFARSFCQQEFAAHGLDPVVAQCNISYNEQRGTLRGMHYQAAPYGEAKLVRVTIGAIYDAIIDLRRDSATLGQWFATTLRADARSALFVPAGFAHGFLTLEDRTEVFYQMSAFYEPVASRGLRWDDPTFAVDWPEAPRVISERDAAYPDYDLSRNDA